MTRKTARPPADRAVRTPPRPAPGFTPVSARTRSDGWTPARQVAFVEALAECGCVEEACARVGMSTTAAYQLRRRSDAASFREAWELALDYAIRRLSDAVFARALHGTATPVFYKGEQVGERRRYDEKLAMFLLRYRDPVRYGAWLDAREARRHPDGAAQLLNVARARVAQDATAQARGDTPPTHVPIAGQRHVTDEEQRIAGQEAAERAARDVEERDRAAKEAAWNRYLEERADIPLTADPGHVARDAVDPGEGEDVWAADWEEGDDDEAGEQVAAPPPPRQAPRGADAAGSVSGADVAPTSPTSAAAGRPGDDRAPSPEPP